MIRLTDVHTGHDATSIILIGIVSNGAGWLGWIQAATAYGPEAGAPGWEACHSLSYTWNKLLGAVDG